VGVRDLAVRGVRHARATIAVAALALGAGACDGPREIAPAGAEVAYLRDAASRRRALEASLVDPSNGYSTLRLARYATGAGDDWERLGEWNPRAAPVRPGALGAGAPPVLPADATALTLPDEATWTADAASRRALVALGEAAFFRYPAQLAPTAFAALPADAVARYGLWIDDARGVGGLVVTETAANPAVALTCSSCHADVVAGRLVAGLPSARFDIGLALLDGGAVPDDATAANLAAWGPGRLDVTTGDGSVPERIADLRSVGLVSHLQYDATVRQADVVSLAIRIETLIITGHGQSIRPPRIVALALAAYLWSLSDELPATRTTAGPGRALFAARCASCHAGEALTGAPRPIAEIGTDPLLGLSPDRGTGLYRVPSLRGVGARPTLLHDGTLRGLEALLDPGRLAVDYDGGARAPGPVAGHAFGLDLSAADRAALLEYVSSL
jgi:hypothetical protein